MAGELLIFRWGLVEIVGSGSLAVIVAGLVIVVVAGTWFAAMHIRLRR